MHPRRECELIRFADLSDAIRVRLMDYLAQSSSINYIFQANQDVIVEGTLLAITEPELHQVLSQQMRANSPSVNTTLQCSSPTYHERRSTAWLFRTIEDVLTARHRLRGKQTNLMKRPLAMFAAWYLRSRFGTGKVGEAAVRDLEEGVAASPEENTLLALYREIGSYTPNEVAMICAIQQEVLPHSEVRLSEGPRRVLSLSALSIVARRALWQHWDRKGPKVQRDVARWAKGHTRGPPDDGVADAYLFVPFLYHLSREESNNGATTSAHGKTSSTIIDPDVLSIMVSSIDMEAQNNTPPSHQRKLDLAIARRGQIKSPVLSVSPTTGPPQGIAQEPHITALSPGLISVFPPAGTIVKSTSVETESVPVELQSEGGLTSLTFLSQAPSIRDLGYNELEGYFP